MSDKAKQASLGNFFSSSKRKAEENENDAGQPPSKNQKVDEPSQPPQPMPDFTDATFDNLESMLEPSWREKLKDEFTKPYWKQMQKDLVEKSKKETIFPPIPKLFAAFWLCPFDSTRVVILGQDPYHGPGQAEGLCFSVPRGEKIPSSLHNIYRELTTDIGGFTKPKHGNLVEWAEQGVLLLNNILTVPQASPNAHKDIGWAKFTDAVVNALAKDAESNPRVWMLWGSFAQTKAKSVSAKNQCILKTTHPSGLSAHKGFIGSKHFSQCNDYLQKNGKKPIKWQV